MIDKHKIPNLLTFGRLAAIPFLVAGFYLPQPYAALTTSLVFAAASITDWLDGYLARKWNAGSTMGRILDPVADKLLVVAALIPLAISGVAPMIPTLLILLREVLISGLREGLSARQVTLHVSTLAKYKTALQMAAIVALLASPLFAALATPGKLMLWVAALLTAWTGYQYGVASFQQLKD